MNPESKARLHRRLQSINATINNETADRRNIFSNRANEMDSESRRLSKALAKVNQSIDVTSQSPLDIAPR
jgi:hypothetical protein